MQFFGRFFAQLHLTLHHFHLLDLPLPVVGLLLLFDHGGLHLHFCLPGPLFLLFYLLLCLALYLLL